MRKVTLLLATTALAALLTVVPAWADTTFTVDSANDAPDADPGDGACSTAANECTLRAAIGEANALSGNDVIGFDPSVSGTITLGGSELLINSNLKIEGPGADELSVDANSQSRVFDVQSGTLEISGLTITGGKTDDGSTDICSNADYGGGIFNEATLMLSDSTISRATSECGGGGIYNRGTLTVSNSTITDNTTTHGSAGGIFVEGADTTTISDTTVTRNTAAFNGGGISSGGYAVLTVSDSTISDNTSGYDGGGVYSIPNDRDRGSTSVERSTISGNEAARNGGGIYSRSVSIDGDSGVSKTTVANSTISANTAKEGYGGGLHNENGLTQIGHSTITDNTAPTGQGGGVASYGDGLTRTEVYSSVISANTHTDVDFVLYPGDNSTPRNSFVSEGHNLVGDGNATAALDAQGDQTGVSDPKLGPLQDNGGPTQTHLPLETQGSPVIDRGNGAEGPATDQRGETRPQDHPAFANAQGSDGSDVGAVEVAASAEPPPPPPPEKPVCTIKGTGGRDVLRGTARRDVICAYGGNDTVRGMAGNDLIMGGAGSDTILGDEGDDTIYGGDGKDTIQGNAGNDTIYGGSNNDTMQGNDGRDKLYGGSGDDTMQGGAGADLLKGGTGQDTTQQ